MTRRVQLYDLLKESFLLLDFGDRLFFEQYGLSIPRYYAMHHIAATPGLLPSQLSEIMFCDRSNITRLLQGLEADGLVARRPHERDGRAQRLFLTPAGEALHSRVSADHQRYVEERLRALAGAESEGLTATLSRLTALLAEQLAARDPLGSSPRGRAESAAPV